MLMPGRKYSAENSYRYGFNRKENDNEVKGEGAQQDYGMRVYDPRIGKFLSVDPLSKHYPWNSTYAFAENDVIRCIDLDGLEKYLVIYTPAGLKGIAKLEITAVADIKTQEPINMEIKFKDPKKHPNDDSKEVLIIGNDFRYANSKIKEDQYNDDNLNAFEISILENSGELKPEKNKNFNILVHNNGKEEGRSRDFQSKENVEVFAQGYVAGRDFNAGAFNTYNEIIKNIISDISIVEPNRNIKSLSISITSDTQIDEEVKKAYTNFIEKNYGTMYQIEVHWQTNENKDISKRKPGANANITIGATL